jgi:hypothetical protein
MFKKTVVSIAAVVLMNQTSNPNQSHASSGATQRSTSHG